MKRIFIILSLLLLPRFAWAQNLQFVSATPVVDTAIYASGDLIGGKETFTAAVRPIVGTGFITSVEIADKSAQATDLDLIIFGQDPSNTTFTDQSAFDPDDLDLSKIQAVIHLDSTTRFAYTDNGTKYLGSLLIPVRATTSTGGVGTTLYGALVSRGTPTFAAASDVKITLAISQN